MITQDQKKQILDLRARRYSQEKIAKILKISRSTVHRFLRKHLYGSRIKFIDGKCAKCGTSFVLPLFMKRHGCLKCRTFIVWNALYFHTRTGTLSRY